MFNESKNKDKVNDLSKTTEIANTGVKSETKLKRINSKITAKDGMLTTPVIIIIISLAIVSIISIGVSGSIIYKNRKVQTNVTLDNTTISNIKEVTLGDIPNDTELAIELEEAKRLETQNNINAVQTTGTLESIQIRGSAIRVIGKFNDKDELLKFIDDIKGYSRIYQYVNGDFGVDAVENRYILIGIIDSKTSTSSDLNLG